MLFREVSGEQPFGPRTSPLDLRLGPCDATADAPVVLGPTERPRAERGRGQDQDLRSPTVSQEVTEMDWLLCA